MNRAEREARLQRAKVLGRVAYRHLQCCEIVGVLTYEEDEEKHLYMLDEDGLTAELIVPFRPHALPNEFSRIQIRADGRKVFEIRWDGARKFQAHHLRAGRMGAHSAQLARAHTARLEFADVAPPTRHSSAPVYLKVSS